MINLDKISLKNIREISKILSDSKVKKIDFIKRQYERNASNYENTINLLETIGLVMQVNGKINLRKNYEDFLKRYGDGEYSDQMLKKYLISNILLKRNLNTNIFKEFLNNFEYMNNAYIFKSSTAQKIKYSGVRNLLLELDFIMINEKSKDYVVNNNYVKVFIKFNERHKVSIKKFRLLSKQKENLGYNAELEIIKYERKKLVKHPILKEKIEHVSEKDVSAGYDIKSYEKKQGGNKQPITIYIEVKAVSINDYKFNWSKNEIEKAKESRNKYYLYLLPVTSKNKFSVNDLMIINNPYKNVYKNRKQWESSIELISFKKLMDLFRK